MYGCMNVLNGAHHSMITEVASTLKYKWTIQLVMMQKHMLQLMRNPCVMEWLLSVHSVQMSNYRIHITTRNRHLAM